MIQNVQTTLVTEDRFCQFGRGEEVSEGRRRTDFFDIRILDFLSWLLSSLWPVTGPKSSIYFLAYLVLLCCFTHSCRTHTWNKRQSTNRIRNVCPLHSHSMWSQDILHQLLVVQHFIRPHILFSPYWSRHLSQRHVCQDFKKNLAVRGWSTDMLSFYNAKQWESLEL